MDLKRTRDQKMFDQNKHMSNKFAGQFNRLPSLYLHEA